MKLSAPEPIATHHEVEEFDSGVASLDEWLKRRAMQNQVNGASRTFVTCQINKVVGYYALASSAVVPAQAPGRFKRNMPDPIPVVVLGRLAVHKSHQGQGLGRALFQDAARRVLYAATAIGIRGILVHALNPAAKAFYLQLGLTESPLDPMMLMVTLAALQAALD
mgnify:CR=1 FL=1